MDPFVPEQKQSELQRELSTLLNRFSRENVSDTPDFLLAEFLTDCLAAFEKATRERERWYGRYVMGKPGGIGMGPYPRVQSECIPPSEPSQTA